MSALSTDILNWREWSSEVSLSGQPTEAQLADLKAQGVENVINLGPHSNEGALPDEAGTVANLGMIYIYIPVDFDAPTQGNFNQFSAALDRCAGTRTHVHCIYNARVSAFMYARAKSKGARVQDAFDIMDGIWRPGAIWSELIGREPPKESKNLYAGYDY